MLAISALILAAGRATRFGAATSKLAAVLEGKALVRHVAEAALAARTDEVLVVTGHDAVRVRAALAGLDLCFVHNEAFASGMASSLRAGLEALNPQAAGVVVLLGDMPRIGAALIDRLVETFISDGASADAIVPVFEGRQGNPVLLGRSVFPALAGLAGDQGARRILGAPGRRILVCPVDDAGIEIDVDTTGALDRLRHPPIP